MTTETAGQDTLVNPFDSWASILVALFLALVGYTVMVSVPVLSTALVQKVGLTDPQAGRIWGADLGGFSVGAVFTALTVARINRRTLVLGGVVLSIVANGLCLLLDSYEQLYALRIMAGIGSGIFTAVAVVTLGGTTKPVHAFNLLLFGFAFSTAAELHFLPQLEMNEVYIFFIILSALCAILVRAIPARPIGKERMAQIDAMQGEVEDWRVPIVLPILCLVAVCFTYINIGGYYTYAELAALDDGVSQEWTGPVLTWSSFLAVVGCAIAYFATRYGLFKPLFFGLISMGAVVAMLSFGVTDTTFMISMFGFMTLWTFADVYQSAMLSHMDRAGALVALLPSVQGLGQSVGPNVAASILDAELGYDMVFLVSGSMAIIAMVIYMGIAFYMHHRKAPSAPAIA